MPRQSGEYSLYVKGRQEWSCCELMDRRKTWTLSDGRADRERRVIYCIQKTDDKGQLLLAYVARNSIIYTNVGLGEKIYQYLSRMGFGDTKDILRLTGIYFDRGSDELVNRAFKEFLREKLLFQSFNKNAAYYYLSLISFFPGLVLTRISQELLAHRRWLLRVIS